MSYGSRRWGLWRRRGGGLTSLRLRHIMSSPSQKLCRPLVRKTDDGRCSECSMLPPFVAALFFTLRDSYGWQHCRPVCSEARYSSRIAFLPIPPAFYAPVRVFLLEHRHPVWYGNTRMVWLPDGEKMSKICLFVLTWSTNVTDRQTDRQTDGRTDSPTLQKSTWRHRPSNFKVVT